jgi:hypothetical protein
MSLMIGTADNPSQLVFAPLGVNGNINDDAS